MDRKFPELVSHELSVSSSTTTQQINRNNDVPRREVKKLGNAKGREILERKDRSSTTKQHTESRCTTARNLEDSGGMFSNCSEKSSQSRLNYPAERHIILTARVKQRHFQDKNGKHIPRRPSFRDSLKAVLEEEENWKQRTGERRVRRTRPRRCQEEQALLWRQIQESCIVLAQRYR